MSLKKNLAGIALLVTASASAMHCINKIVYRISTIENRLFNKDEKYYSWRFGRISYTVQGSGKPVLLIHDLDVCSSSYEWKNIRENLSETNTVYTIDLLGCGCSEKPNITYTNYLYVQLINDFIKNIIKEKSDIVVSGQASGLALMACSNDSTLIDRMILVNPEDLVSLSKVPTRKTKLYKHILSVPVIGTFIYNLFVNKRTIEKKFRQDYFYDVNKVNENDIMAYFEASHRSNTNGKYLYSSIISNFTKMNIIQNLKKLENSIFIITGSSNPENILAANQYQNFLPSIEIAEMEHTKQLPHMESPEEFLQNIKLFLEID